MPRLPALRYDGVVTTASLPPGVVTLVEAMATVPGVHRVILFGSRAKGSERPRSDVDLAIDAPGVDGRAWDHLCELADNAETLLQFDLIRLDKANSDFCDEILREGRTLYVRSDDRA